MSLRALVIQALGASALAVAAAGLAVLLGLLSPARGRLAEWAGSRRRVLLGWAWGASLVATLGSLWFSEVVGLLPCEFCWYQRIAMYPLVVVLGVGLLRNDADTWRFGLLLPAAGILFSAYHVALQNWPGPPPESCQGGVPCSSVYVAVFGFVSIPVMAGAGFLFIGALLTLLAVSRR